MKTTILAVVGVCFGMTISSGLLALAETRAGSQPTDAEAFVSAVLDAHHRAATGFGATTRPD